jgi:MoaA/NifB/PqqE/SkfB family radical SAM enzyme
MTAIMPDTIRLEASSFCQLKCPSCPTASGAIHPAVGSGVLRLENFAELLDKNPGLTRIELSNYGEVFLNPHLLDILELAHRKGVAITLANGVNLNNARETVLEGLVKYQVRLMNCAIDGASDETYRRYRVGGNFDRVIENIRTINRYKQQYGSPFPELRWQFIVFGHNEHEIPKARDMARALGMPFYTKISWDSEVSPIRDAAWVRKETGLAAVTRDEYTQAYGTDYASGLCDQLWDDPQINWDGKVLGCCRNFWGDFGGNAFQDGLIQSVNSEKMSYARAMLAGQAPERDDIPCTSCDIYQGRCARSQWVKR